MKSTYYHPYNFMWKCYSKSFITIPWKFKCKSPVADLHTKVSGAYPPPTGPNSFVFTYVFTKKHLCQRLVPPPMRVGAPQWKILDPPLQDSHVLYKIINKTHAKVIIAQNNTDLSCIELDIHVSKCFTKAQHFETLISSLIQDVSVSF